MECNVTMATLIVSSGNHILPYYFSYTANNKAASYHFISISSLLCHEQAK